VIFGCPTSYKHEENNLYGIIEALWPISEIYEGAVYLILIMALEVVNAT
jgi:hypothetical protein